MPALIDEKTVSNSVKTKGKVQASAAQDPLAGKQLQCPYCGCAYLPEEGCFCVRVVGWNGKPIGQ
jgi:hypothetical protein